MIQIKERIGKLLAYLGEQIYPQRLPIGQYRMRQMTERPADIAALDTSDWEVFSSRQLWGGHRAYYCFETEVTIPAEFDGKCVVYELLTGREGSWDATNPQFSIYVNGRMVQGLDVNHREIVLSEPAAAGEHFRILLSAFTGDQNFSLQLDSALKVLDRETEQYYYDVSVPYETARLLPAEDSACITILQKLNESLNLLDLRREGSEAYRESLRRAQRCLREEFYDKYTNPAAEPVIACVGHTHIDCAWLWTLSVTEDKAVRSFSTVLNLMRQYPEYIFMSSQPQLYKYVKKNAPEVYAELKERVREGRWEPEGGMFVEADCNLASGEALVRQLLVGRQFFREEFGVENEILWLPDVFGYSAALPQILKKSGMPYFMTTKISWNEFNKMPYDTFIWEGLDGSSVLTHFVPTRDYQKAAVEGGTETAHFTTYNAYLNPSQMKGAWARYSQKALNKEVLCSFGYGDGGGGPTREQLEHQRRMAAGIPGCPRTRMSTAGAFFRRLEADCRDKRELPRWVGELYLEYHRGTYTSMARNKKWNRRAEFSLQNGESYALMAQGLCKAAYPKDAMDECWEILLRNQFHDILPGSSIREVYEDSRAEYERLFEVQAQVQNACLSAVAEAVDAPRRSLLVFNPTSAQLPAAVMFDCPESIPYPRLWDGDRELALQRTYAGRWLFVASVPAKGYQVFRLEEAELHGGDRRIAEAAKAGMPGSDVSGKAAKAGMPGGDVSCEAAKAGMFRYVAGDGEKEETAGLYASAQRMENDFFILELNKCGQFCRIYDKREGRELLPPGERGNVMVSYEDRPHNYDAWDVNYYYTEKAWEIDELLSAEVIERGPVRAVLRLRYQYLESTIEQDICLYRELPRIDILHRIDWREHQLFLKNYFPVDVHTNEAVFDIQFGNVRRPTHRNTSWDIARFEVCHHKWLDVSEEGYGLSVLNDCKYGVSVEGSKIGLSMLKSPIYPNPEADKEMHEFAYSLYPHSGGWQSADTVAQAYLFNNPLQAVIKENEGGLLPESFSMFSVDMDNVVIEAAKQAEDGSGIIVRLYECHNRRTRVRLDCGLRFEQAFECNLMELPERRLSAQGQSLTLTFKPYEIKTILLK